MQDDEIIFDVETKLAFADLADRSNLAGLGISVLGAFSYRTGEFHAFFEPELHLFEEMLTRARRVIGYNIKHFDFPVLQPYLNSVHLRDIPALDLMLDPTENLNFRPKLDDLAKATLGVSKSGHGLDAIRWFREGKLEQLKNYCLGDVKITRDLYEYGRDKGEVLIESRYGGAVRKVPVKWTKLPEMTSVQHPLFT